MLWAKCERNAVTRNCFRVPQPDRERGSARVRLPPASWAALLKGIVWLLDPAERVPDAYKGIGFFHVWMVVVLAIGPWTAAVAFIA